LRVEGREVGWTGLFVDFLHAGGAQRVAAGRNARRHENVVAHGADQPRGDLGRRA